ncbi:RDD family protein [Streptomyces sp. 21So2-11]|uniref:RDD family protein n=1 Tax=Streptomyces sp. 21So2-11 TaxID=3144408 RepID=UPI00321BFCCB
MVASPGDGTDVAREGYYPDPSIPGYVRYWNGAAWVPGTSRPAPATGEAMPAGSGAGAVAPAPAAVRRPSVEETGPVFFDEEPEGAHLHGSAPEPASAWQADTSRQTGFGGERDRRVSWGSPSQDPRAAGDSDSGSGWTPRSGEGASAARDPRSAGADAGAGAGAGAAQAGPGAGSPAGPTGDPSRGALPGVRSAGQAPGPGQAHGEAPGAGHVHGQAQGPGQVHGQVPGPAQGQGRADSGPAVPADSTMAIRALRAGATGAAAAAESARTARADGTMAIRTMTPGARNPQVPAQSQQPQSQQPQQQAPQPQPAPVAPAPAPAPATSVSGGGAASWAQQVHRLAQQEHGGAQSHQQQAHQPQSQQDPQQPVVPWKPVASSDPFLRAAQAQAAARPAGLGRRLAARLVDTVVLGAAVGAVGVPLVSKALTHIDDKVQAAKLSGETVTVWLIDSTTASYLGIVLGAFLLFGVVYEVFPTSKWGRTLGKKLFRLHVRDIEEHEPPTFAAALRRWLLYGVLGVLAIGIVNVAWCLFDRPWRQCWHDKAAHTFVAGNS